MPIIVAGRRMHADSHVSTHTSCRRTRGVCGVVVRDVQCNRVNDVGRYTLGLYTW